MSHANYKEDSNVPKVKRMCVWCLNAMLVTRDVTHASPLTLESPCAVIIGGLITGPWPSMCANSPGHQCVSSGEPCCLWNQQGWGRAQVCPGHNSRHWAPHTPPPCHTATVRQFNRC